MKRNKNLLFAAVAVICVIAAAYITDSFAAEKKYEVETQYSLSDSRTGMDRAIDAYQQMINRLLDSNEKNNGLILVKLEAIQKDLQTLSARIEKIEKAVSPCEKKCAEKCKIADPNLPVTDKCEKK